MFLFCFWSDIPAFVSTLPVVALGAAVPNVFKPVVLVLVVGSISIFVCVCSDVSETKRWDVREDVKMSPW
jgi:hypothetical protein